jgi:aryl-alcohol dehydrogenase-like predicted oxidoreductase
MRERALGRQGLVVSAIGYGAMEIAGGYGPADETESTAAIRTAYETGITHFDTAEMYGWGASERLLGAAVAPFRDDVTIATKFGYLPGYGRDSRPDHIRQVVDRSLLNLGVDRIDLLYQHVPDPDVPVEEVVGVMAEFVQAGKVVYLGLSNADADALRRADAFHPISALQFEYSIFALDVEPLLPVLEELGIGLVAYSPLARGFLSGSVVARDRLGADDYRRRIPWWMPENVAANVEIVARLTELATAKGITLAQLALAWLLSRRDFIVPIPGSRSPHRVALNAAAEQLTLTEDDLRAIRSIAPLGGVGGRLS